MCLKKYKDPFEELADNMRKGLEKFIGLQDTEETQHSIKNQIQYALNNHIMKHEVIPVYRTPKYTVRITIPEPKKIIICA